MITSQFVNFNAVLEVIYRRTVQLYNTFKAFLRTPTDLTDYLTRQALSEEYLAIQTALMAIPDKEYALLRIINPVRHEQTSRYLLQMSQHLAYNSPLPQSEELDHSNLYPDEDLVALPFQENEALLARHHPISNRRHIHAGINRAIQELSSVLRTDLTPALADALDQKSRLDKWMTPPTAGLKTPPGLSDLNA